MSELSLSNSEVAFGRRGKSGNLELEATLHIPTNNLKPKVPSQGGPELKDIVASATAALAKMEGEYEVWAGQDVQRLAAFLDKAKKSAKAPKRTDKGDASEERMIEEIHVICHNIKGQAATFNFPLLTSAAKSLCHLIQEDEVTAAKRLDLVEAHVHAMQVILAQKIKGSGGEAGRGLISALEQAVEKILGRKA